MKSTIFRYTLATCSITVALILAGCAANYGASSINDYGRFLNLEKGKSTKLDVYNAFGQPVDVVAIPQSNESYWKYIVTKSTMNGATFIPFVGLVFGGNNEDVKTAVFYFGTSDVMEKVETTDKDRYQNQWIAMGKIASEGSDRDAARARIEAEMIKLGKVFDKRSFNQQYQTDQLQATK